MHINLPIAGLVALAVSAVAAPVLPIPVAEPVDAVACSCTGDACTASTSGSLALSFEGERSRAHELTIPVSELDKTTQSKRSVPDGYTTIGVSAAGGCPKNSDKICDDYNNPSSCRCLYQKSDDCAHGEQQLCDAWGNNCHCVATAMTKRADPVGITRPGHLKSCMPNSKMVCDDKDDHSSCHCEYDDDDSCPPDFYLYCDGYDIADCTCVLETVKRSVSAKDKTVPATPAGSCPDKSIKICDDVSNPNTCACVVEDDGCADGEEKLCNSHGKDCRCIDPSKDKTAPISPAGSCPDKSTKHCDDAINPNTCVCVSEEHECADGEEKMSGAYGSYCHRMPARDISPRSGHWWGMPPSWGNPWGIPYCNYTPDYQEPFQTPWPPRLAMLRRSIANAFCIDAPPTPPANLTEEAKERMGPAIVDAVIAHMEAHPADNSTADVPEKVSEEPEAEVAEAYHREGLQRVVADALADGAVLNTTSNMIELHTVDEVDDAKKYGLEDEGLEKHVGGATESSDSSTISQDPNTSPSPQLNRRWFGNRMRVWPIAGRPPRRKPLTPEQINYKREQFADCERRKGTRRCSIEWEEFESRIDAWRVRFIKDGGLASVMEEYNMIMYRCAEHWRETPRWCRQHEYDSIMGGMGPGKICGSVPMLFYCATGRILPKERQHMPRLPVFMFDAPGHRWDTPWRNGTGWNQTVVGVPMEVNLTETQATLETQMNHHVHVTEEEAAKGPLTPGMPPGVPTEVNSTETQMNHRLHAIEKTRVDPKGIGTPPRVKRSGDGEGEEPLEHDVIDVIREVDPETADRLVRERDKRWLHYTPQFDNDENKFEMSDNIDDIEFQLRPPRAVKRESPDPDWEGWTRTVKSESPDPECSEECTADVDVVKREYTSHKTVSGDKEQCLGLGLSWITKDGWPHCEDRPLSEEDTKALKQKLKTTQELKSWCLSNGHNWVDKDDWSYCDDQNLPAIDGSKDDKNNDKPHNMKRGDSRSKQEQKYRDMQTRCDMFGGIWQPYPMFSRDHTRRPYCRNPHLPAGADKIVTVDPELIMTDADEMSGCIERGYYWNTIRQTCFLQPDGSGEWKPAPAGWEYMTTELENPIEKRVEVGEEEYEYIQRPDPDTVEAQTEEEQGCKEKGYWWDWEKDTCYIRPGENPPRPAPDGWWIPDEDEAQRKEYEKSITEFKPWTPFEKIDQWITDHCGDFCAKHPLVQLHDKVIKVMDNQVEKYINDPWAPFPWSLVFDPDPDENCPDPYPGPGKKTKKVKRGTTQDWKPASKQSDESWYTAPLTVPGDMFPDYTHMFPSNQTYENDRKFTLTEECEDKALWRECIDETEKTVDRCKLWSPCVDGTFPGLPMVAKAYEKDWPLPKPGLPPKDPYDILDPPYPGMDIEGTTGGESEVVRRDGSVQESSSERLEDGQQTSSTSEVVKGVDRGRTLSRAPDVAYVGREDWMKKDRAVDEKET